MSTRANYVFVLKMAGFLGCSKRLIILVDSCKLYDYLARFFQAGHLFLSKIIILFFKNGMVILQDLMRKSDKTMHRLAKSLKITFQFRLENECALRSSILCCFKFCLQIFYDCVNIFSSDGSIYHMSYEGLVRIFQNNY